MNKELKKQLENLTKNAKRYTGPRINDRKSSLSQVIKTKEQAEWFMKMLKIAEEDK